MSIRCSEMNIPAAVGVGDDIYQSLSNKNTIELNCVEKLKNYDYRYCTISN